MDQLTTLHKNIKEAKAFFLICETNTGDFEDIHKKMADLLLSIEQKIQAICDHEYVYDYIDVDPDKSQQICYCEKCLHSIPI